VGEGKSVYRFLVGKSEGKRPLGRPKLRWEDNIKANFQDLVIDWIELAEYKDRWWKL
jgi:hypothetical protein